MISIAFLLDGPPPTWWFVRLVLVCFFAPALSMGLSWFLVRKVKAGSLWSFCFGGVAAYLVINWAYDLYNWGYPYSPTPLFWLGPLASAQLSLASVVAVALHQAKEPNRPQN